MFEKKALSEMFLSNTQVELKAAGRFTLPRRFLAIALHDNPDRALICVLPEHSAQAYFFKPNEVPPTELEKIKLTIDAKGRIQMTPAQRAYLGTEGQSRLTVVGRRDFFSICTPETFLKRRAQAREYIKSLRRPGAAPA